MEHRIKFYQWYVVELRSAKEFFCFWLTIKALFTHYTLCTSLGEIDMAVPISINDILDCSKNLKMRVYFLLRPSKAPVIATLSPGEPTTNVPQSGAIRLLKELHLYNSLNRQKQKKCGFA